MTQNLSGFNHSTFNDKEEVIRYIKWYVIILIMIYNMYPHSIIEDNGKVFTAWFSRKELSSKKIPRSLVPMNRI